MAEDETPETAHRLEVLPLLVGLAAVVVSALFLFADTTDLDITEAAAWSFGLAGLGLAGLVLAWRRVRGTPTAP